jgi:hypothetical protein
MNQLDDKHWRFYRTDPTPWIPFDQTTVRGDHAVFWVAVAAAIIAVLVL